MHFGSRLEHNVQFVCGCDRPQKLQGLLFRWHLQPYQENVLINKRFFSSIMKVCTCFDHSRKSDSSNFSARLCVILTLQQIWRALKFIPFCGAKRTKSRTSHTITTLQQCAQSEDFGKVLSWSRWTKARVKTRCRHQMYVEESEFQWRESRVERLVSRNRSVLGHAEPRGHRHAG